MTEMSKISFEALEEITGGKIVTVANGAVNYANIRHTPGLNTLIDGSDNAWIAGSLIGF